MKKLVLAMLILSLFSLHALAEENWYQEISLDLGAKVGELAKDESFQECMTSVKLSWIDELKDVDFDARPTFYRAGSGKRDWIAKLWTGLGVSGLSDAGKEKLRQSATEAALTQYVAEQGSDALTASVLLTFTRTYRMPEDFEPCVWIAEYDGALISVSFVATGEDTITATAKPLFSETGSIENVLDSMGEQGLNFEKVEDAPLDD